MEQQATIAKPATRLEHKPAQPKLWHVVLIDDQDHTYDYVIEMTMRLFGHPLPKALSIAEAVDKAGRAVCVTTHKELAELKQEQIHAYGADRAIASCKGSMSAMLIPADLDEGDSGE